MTTISLTKEIPNTSYWYDDLNGAGGKTSKTVTLAGVQEINMNTKKVMIKIKVPTDERTNDNPDIKVVDLKQIEETMTIRGWVEDDVTNTAWTKVWWLRAMCNTGGALSNLTVGNQQFKSTTISAFLEDVTWTLIPDDTEAINSSAGTGIARIQIQLTVYFGEDYLT